MDTDTYMVDVKAADAGKAGSKQYFPIALLVEELRSEDDEKRIHSIKVISLLQNQIFILY